MLSTQQYRGKLGIYLSIYHLWLDGIIDSMDMNLGKFQEMVRDGEAWHAAVHGVTRVRLERGNKVNSVYLVSKLFI